MAGSESWSRVQAEGAGTEAISAAQTTVLSLSAGSGMVVPIFVGRGAQCQCAVVTYCWGSPFPHVRFGRTGGRV